MKIIATSDFHGMLPPVEDVTPCDVLVIAGDIAPDHPAGKRERYALDDNGASFQADWLQEEFQPWLDSLGGQVRHVLAVWGNHDFVGEPNRFGVEPPALEGITLLNDESIVIDGVKFHGTPWVPGLPRWAFYGSEEFLKARAESIPSDVDVLISHGPPYGTADFVAPQFGSLSVGDRAMAGTLGSLYSPQVFICGHIHEQYGTHEHNGVYVANVSYVDENYVPGNRPMDFLVEPRDRVCCGDHQCSGCPEPYEGH